MSEKESFGPGRVVDRVARLRRKVGELDCVVSRPVFAPLGSVAVLVVVVLLPLTRVLGHERVLVHGVPIAKTVLVAAVLAGVLGALPGQVLPLSQEL